MISVNLFHLWHSPINNTIFSGFTCLHKSIASGLCQILATNAKSLYSSIELGPSASFSCYFELRVAGPGLYLSNRLSHLPCPSYHGGHASWCIQPQCIQLICIIQTIKRDNNGFELVQLETLLWISQTKIKSASLHSQPPVLKHVSTKTTKTETAKKPQQKSEKTFLFFLSMMDILPYFHNSHLQTHIYRKKDEALLRKGYS